MTRFFFYLISKLCCKATLFYDIVLYKLAFTNQIKQKLKCFTGLTNTNPANLNSLGHGDEPFH